VAKVAQTFGRFTAETLREFRGNSGRHPSSSRPMRDSWAPNQKQATAEITDGCLRISTERIKSGPQI
ncbi:MAG: hypothetical protein ACYTGL_18540, partial [Planctomycetota bacterium]